MGAVIYGCWCSGSRQPWAIEPVDDFYTQGDTEQDSTPDADKSTFAYTNSAADLAEKEES